MEIGYEIDDTFECASAASVYMSEDNSPMWSIKEYYDLFRDLMSKREDVDIRVQAWQYVKAYTKLLKDHNEWDYDRCAPKEIPWRKLTPHTAEWYTFYQRNPDDMQDMDSYSKDWDTKQKIRKQGGK